MRVYRYMALSARDYSDAADSILETALVSLEQNGNFDWRYYEKRFSDPIAELAAAWIDIGQPGNAIETLDVRYKVPRMKPPIGELPIEDSDERAKALALLGRMKEALLIVETADTAFAKLPSTDPVRNHVLWASTHGNWRPAGSQEIKVGWHLACDIIDALVLEGKANELRENFAGIARFVDTDRISDAINKAEGKRPARSESHPQALGVNMDDIQQSEVDPALKELRKKAREGHAVQALEQVLSTSPGLPRRNAVLVIAEGLAERN